MTGSGSAPGRLTRRKGFHPIVWVLIVFATILALLIVTIAILGWYLVNQFSADPVAATETVLSVLDPDLQALHIHLCMTQERARVILSYTAGN